MRECPCFWFLETAYEKDQMSSVNFSFPSSGEETTFQVHNQLNLDGGNSRTKMPPHSGILKMRFQERKKKEKEHCLLRCIVNFQHTAVFPLYSYL